MSVGRSVRPSFCRSVLCPSVLVCISVYLLLCLGVYLRILAVLFVSQALTRFHYSLAPLPWREKRLPICMQEDFRCIEGWVILKGWGCKIYSGVGWGGSMCIQNREDAMATVNLPRRRDDDGASDLDDDGEEEMERTSPVAAETEVLGGTQRDNVFAWSKRGRMYVCAHVGKLPFSGPAMHAIFDIKVNEYFA
eukprot:748082-Hanusia_phi.AAC.4